MKTATKQQIIAINTILSKRGLMEDKAGIIGNATEGRTTHSSELSYDEAYSLLASLNKDSSTAQAEQKMVRKMFAMAHEMGWITRKAVVTPSAIKMQKDNTRLYDWVKKYGYLHKPLKEYTYAELPKLLSQFEFGPYKDYISKP